MPSLLEGTKMTVKITLLGLIGGTILGFLAGVITTYVKVLVTWKTTAIAVVSIVALYILLRLASWLGDTVLSGVPDWAWLTLQIVVAVLLLVRFAAYIPVALSFLAQLYILVILGTPIVVQVMFIYFPLISEERGVG